MKIIICLKAATGNGYNFYLPCIIRYKAGIFRYNLGISRYNQGILQYFYSVLNRFSVFFVLELYSYLVLNFN